MTSYLQVPCILVPPADYPPADPAIDYTFPLDIWQQHAVAAIHAGHNVFVTAKTGSGKTLVGEYQIAHSLRQGKRVFYTTPIKSLSNQKYHDLKHLFPKATVGIMTGDIKSAPEADIVVMTTEILRNLLFKQSTSTATIGTAGQISLKDVDAVVFDEVHYINDPDRGHVWEETLILLPKEVHLILLSATIDSSVEFATWLGGAKQKPITLLSTTHRIVPLIHGVWDPVQTPLPLRALKAGDEAPYNGRVYDDWLKGKELRLRAAEDWAARVSAAKATGDSIAGAAGKVRIHSFTHQLNQVVTTLKERDLLPALFFNFSRKECERYADQVSGSLLDSSDTAAVKHIISFHLHRYMATLEHLPQYHQITKLLERGIAFHHSGLLPLLKEIVELLFSKGYVRVLFCTETFAVGLNMPARTVVFLDLKKPTGGEGGGWRPLRADEYIQMAGRAGRRGKDKQGVVIYLPARQPLEPDEIRGVYTGGLAPLTSRLQFHYDFVLKALHRSQRESTPLWNAVIQNSYWEAQRAHSAGIFEEEVSSMKETLRGLTLSKGDVVEMEEKDRLTHLVKTTTNATKRKAASDLNSWSERHAGPKWQYVTSVWQQHVALSKKIATAEGAITSLRADATHSRVVPILEVLEDWGALKATGGPIPTQTAFGVLATEVNEGNPLLMARLYESGLLATATEEEIVGVLACFITEKDALEKSTHPDSLPAPISPLVKSTLLAIDAWAQSGLATEAKYGVESPSEFWCLSTLWVEIGTEWLTGGDAGELAARFELYEGNLMRGLLKLAALLNEWISLATIKADVDMLHRLRETPLKLLRGIAQPESLYLRL
jgi:superfamily II RNA helicase